MRVRWAQSSSGASGQWVRACETLSDEWSRHVSWMGLDCGECCTTNGRLGRTAEIVRARAFGCGLSEWGLFQGEKAWLLVRGELGFSINAIFLTDLWV